MAARRVFSYWLLPLFSSLVWLGMLLGMLLHWIIDTHRRHYPSMSSNASIAYISDIGAQKMKPLFIAGSATTVVTLDLAFFAERWLRHRGRLARNISTGEKVLSGLSIFWAIAGAAGLILLSIFDVAHHKNMHDGFLLLFIGGYWLSAVFICWEYQRLGIKYRQHRILRSSFWIKLAFILVELVLAIVFASTSFTHNRNIAAIFEWIVAFVFTFYVASFIIDLGPAVYTKDRESRFEKPDEHLGMHDIENGHNGNGYRNGHSNRYTNGHSNGAAGPGPSDSVADRNTPNF